MMATLKTPVKFMDFIMETMSKKVYMVLHENTHNLWVIPDGGGSEPTELPKRLVNMAYVKVDPRVVRVLYGEEGTVNNTDTNELPSDSSGEL